MGISITERNQPVVLRNVGGMSGYDVDLDREQYMRVLFSDRIHALHNKQRPQSVGRNRRVKGPETAYSVLRLWTSLGLNFV